MLEKYFVKPTTVDRIKQSWIIESIEKYLEWTEKEGHSSQTIHRHIPLLVSFGEYAKSKGACSLAGLSPHISDFAAYRESQWKIARTDKTRQKTLNDTRAVISQMLSIVAPGFKRLDRKRRIALPRFDFTEKFYSYLQKERGLSKASMRAYEYALGLFQSYLDRIGIKNVKELSPPILAGFSIDVTDRLGKASLIRVLCPVRVLLRYLFRERLIKLDLSTAVESPRTYESAGLPRAISWDEVRQMLEAVDRRTPLGRRDYAILLLLVTYGLRAREVASIKLDDIDWKNERLHIRERKGGHAAVYPLSTVVADAIIDYLKNGRPKSTERALFFTAHAPKKSVSYSLVAGRARHYLLTAGIEVASKGSHTLRHTCVQRLVDAQFSLKMIGDYVGHKSSESTRIYSKVNIKALREIALAIGEDLL